MDEQWKVISYRSLSGDYPVQQFIDSLEIKAQSKVQDTVKLLREFGIRLGSHLMLKNLLVPNFGNCVL